MRCLLTLKDPGATGLAAWGCLQGPERGFHGPSLVTLLRLDVGHEAAPTLHLLGVPRSFSAERPGCRVRDFQRDGC